MSTVSAQAQTVSSTGEQEKRTGWLVPVNVLLVIAVGLALWEPAWLSLGFHEAMGAAVVVLVIVHLILNREGLARLVQRLSGPQASGRARVGLVVGILLVLDLLALLLSGLVVRPAAAGSRLALATNAWPGIHALTAALLVVFAGVHVGLNAGALQSVVGRFVKWPRGVWAGLLAVAVVFGAISVATTGFLNWFTMPSSSLTAASARTYSGLPTGAGFTPGERGAFPSGTFPSGGALPSGFTPGAGFGGERRGDFTPGASGFTPGAAGFTPGAGRERGGASGTGRVSGGAGFGAGRTPGAAGGFGGAGGYGAYRGAAGAAGRAAVVAPSATGKFGRGLLNVVQFACIIVLVAAITAAIGWLLGRRRGAADAVAAQAPAAPAAPTEVGVGVPAPWTGTQAPQAAGAPAAPDAPSAADQPAQGESSAQAGVQDSSEPPATPADNA